MNVKPALRFLRLTDKSDRLSLSNLALIVCLIKLALVPQASVVDIGALLLALLNYAHGKILDSKAQPDISKDLEQLRQDLTATQAGIPDLTAIKRDVDSIRNATNLGKFGR